MLSLQKLTSRISVCWMFIIMLSISMLYNKMDATTQNFYMFGPNDKLIVFGIKINTRIRYMITVSYIFVNSLIRTMNHNILLPWITTYIQDITVEKHKNTHMFAYEANYVNCAYIWVDFFIYMNMLLVQVDMLLIEMLSNIVVSVFITKYYLDYKKNHIELAEEYELVQQQENESYV